MNKKLTIKYVNNAELYKVMKKYISEVREAEECGDKPPKMPNEVGLAIYQIANRLAYKHNFINYPFREDMISDGMESAVQAAPKFDPERTENPFAFFTQTIHWAFIRRIQKEKKQLYIRYKVIENSVLSGTAFETSDHSDEGTSGYIDLNNDYMVDFVEKYENTMEEKKKIVKDKKKGLEKFME